jgi:hypothetical protein
MTTPNTGYSPHPKTYDDYVAKQMLESTGFGRRRSDLDPSSPQGSVNTGAYGDTAKLWTDEGWCRDPKPLEFPTIEEPEDWRHQALPRTTVEGTLQHDIRNTGPTFVTKPPVTNTIPSGVAGTIAYRFDDNKTDWSLMPWEAVEEINKVLEFGAVKYSSQNWRNGSGFSWTRVLSSLLRHTFSWARGEDLDPESGLSHLAHMGCNVIFLIYYNRYNARYNKDDRVKP